MCTAESAPAGEGVPTPAFDPSSASPFTSTSHALQIAGAALDFLNSAAARDAAAGDLDGAACGEVLIALGEIQSKLTAAHAGFLRRFDAAGAHDADGYGTCSSWLAAKAGLSKKAAKAAVRQMRQLRDRPLLDGALAAGDITDSLAFEIAGWTRKLPEAMREETDKILLQAHAAGACLDDLATIAACAIESWRQQQPDPGDPEDGFDDRFVQASTTFDGAGIIRGNLTPECATAVRAVLESLGKKTGPGDDRTEGKRFHDALQLACQLLLRARLVPDRAGADTTAVVHIPLSQLRAMPGAPELEDAWIRARLGDDGYLTGNDAETAACDAQVVPVVTGTVNPDVIDQIINLARTATAPDNSAPQAPTTAGTGDVTAARDIAATVNATTENAAQDGAEDVTPVGRPETGSPPGSAGSPRHGSPPGPAGPPQHGCPPRPGGPPASELPAPSGPSPRARQALRYAIARLAIDLVSGPSGIAAALRQGLLEKPWNTPSLPLDIGHTRTIPGHIRRAVHLRDRHCAWPHCDRPAAWCDIHHLRHQADGGETSLANCILLCQYHHDIAIHRHGWTLTLHPDGTTQATSPDGHHILHSHPPRAPQSS